MDTVASADGGTWSANTPATFTTVTTTPGGYITTTTTNVPLIGGGGGVGQVQPYITTSPGIVRPFTSVGLRDLLVSSQGAGKLTQTQLDQLMREHTFVEMGNSEFCLFCYALDQYRTRLDHIFVISEE